MPIVMLRSLFDAAFGESPSQALKSAFEKAVDSAESNSCSHDSTSASSINGDFNVVYEPIIDAAAGCQSTSSVMKDAFDSFVREALHAFQDGEPHQAASVRRFLSDAMVALVTLEAAVSPSKWPADAPPRASSPKPTSTVPFVIAMRPPRDHAAASPRTVKGHAKGARMGSLGERLAEPRSNVQFVFPPTLRRRAPPRTAPATTMTPSVALGGNPHLRAPKHRSLPGRLALRALITIVTR